MPRVIEVQPEPEYRLRLKFSDGTEGELDFSDKLDREIYSAWSDESLFESVRVTEYGNISWPNEVDMCADSLYLKVTGKSPEEILDFPIAKKKSA